MGDAPQGSLVGPGRRVGLRIPLRPPVGVAASLPPPEIMRALPTDRAIHVALMALGHGGADYRLGRLLGTYRRRIERLWAQEATRSKG